MIKFPKAVGVCHRDDSTSPRDADRHDDGVHAVVERTSAVAVATVGSGGLEDAAERNYPNPREVDASGLTKRPIQRMP